MTASNEAKGRKVDRRGWEPGPWDEEPMDRDAWTHEGIHCVALRTGMGNWCGYVGIPKDHPAHGKHYDDEVFHGVSVHGGLTYSNTEGGLVQGEEPADVWWVGFDCAHAFDLVPLMVAEIAEHFPDNKDMSSILGTMTYKSLEFVRGEANRLAEQIVAAGKETEAK